MTASDIRTIDFGGEAIKFLIERTSRRKTVAISVGHDGVRVLAPVDVADDHILGIVRKKGPWVLGKQAGYRELGSVVSTHEFVSGETIHYLGRAYRLKVVPDSTTVVTRIVARGSHLIAPVPAGADDMIRRSSVRSGLRLWYHERAKAHFPVRVKAIAGLLGIKTPTVHIVDQSKRWGSCDARGRIRLNWRLVMRRCHRWITSLRTRCATSLSTITPGASGVHWKSSCRITKRGCASSTGLDIFLSGSLARLAPS